MKQKMSMTSHQVIFTISFIFKFKDSFLCKNKIYPERYKKQQRFNVLNEKYCADTYCCQSYAEELLPAHICGGVSEFYVLCHFDAADGELLR